MRRFWTVLAFALTPLLLVPAGCSSGSSDTSGSSASAAPQPSPASGATDEGGTGTPSGSDGCDRVSPSDISTTLGLTVGEAEVTRNGPVTVCTYPAAADGASEVIVRFQTGMSASDLAASRSQFESTDQPTADVAGLGEAAFSSTIGSGSVETNTIETVQQGTDLLITAGAPLAGIETLARQILPVL